MPARHQQGTTSPIAVLGLIVSVVALIISATVAYYSVILRLEELRVVPERLVVVAAFQSPSDPSGPEVVIPDILRVTLINSGNTSIAVMSAEAQFGNLASITDFKNNNACSEEALFDADLTPFVLKENDILIKELKLKPSINNKSKIHSQKDGGITFSLPDPAKKTLSNGILCLRFDLATPSDPLAYGRLVLGAYEFHEQNKDGSWEIDISKQIPAPPNIVWHATRSIFY
jgi:hypothetical protein